MEIHQLLTVADYGDATTNEALEIQRYLSRHGTSHIFSAHPPDPRLKTVRPLHEYAQMASAGSERNVLLLHFSMGHPGLFEFVMNRPERLVMRYHNVTPPEMFQDYDITFAAELAASRRQVAELRDRVDLAIGVSTFNVRDLEGLGYRNTAVVPLILDLDRLLRVRPRRPRFPVPHRAAGPLVLFVGRIAPNKGHPQLLQAFHVLKTYLRSDAHLVMVGSPHHVGYLLTLERFIQELHLPEIYMPGHITTAELVALYRRADVFLCLSDHEGFGVPLVESMAFGVPVIAKAAAAIPETVGDAAILLPDSSPALAAEAVDTVLRDSDLRRRLIAKGHRRVAALRPAPLAGRIRELILRRSD